MTRIGIILGSTRPQRRGEEVARWALDLAQQRDDATFELVDLRDHDLPHYDEPVPPVTGRYQHDHTRRWSERIASFDGLVIVTPEYNHSAPGVLTDALAYLYAEWANKAVGFVSYGGQGGVRAVEHLRAIAGELNMADVRAQVALAFATDFERHRDFKPAAHQTRALHTMLDQVIAWTNALAPPARHPHRVPRRPGGSEHPMNEHPPTPGPVLVVGATGHLGGQVVDQLIARGKRVRALVRPASDAHALQAKGVEIARGDMLDLGTLTTAMTGVDAVITTAAGYTRRTRQATQIDTLGNANLAEAAARTGVRRFVLTSILTCDQTPHVSHFWHKKLAEDELERRGVPFVALRPGAFLDQVAAIGGDPFTTGRLTWFGSTRVPLTFVLTADLAGYLAAAVDADVTPGARIDIGWDRPVTMQDIAALASHHTGKPVKVRAVPAWLLRTVGAVAGLVAPGFKDMGAMVDWFASGQYVADTTRQAHTFGAPPTAEDAVAHFAQGLGHPAR